MITLKKTAVRSKKAELQGYRLAIVNHGTVSIDDAAAMMSINNTITRTDVVAVVAALKQIVEQDLKQGYSVSLGDLGTIQLHVKTHGTNTKGEWSSAMIESTRVRFVPSVKLKKTIALGANGINVRMHNA